LLTLGATVTFVVVHKPRVWSRLGKFALVLVVRAGLDGVRKVAADPSR
jgi:hypothetical protein